MQDDAQRKDTNQKTVLMYTIDVNQKTKIGHTEPVFLETKTRKKKDDNFLGQVEEELQRIRCGEKKARTKIIYKTNTQEQMPYYIQKHQEMSILEKSILEKKIPKGIVNAIEELLYSRGIKNFIIHSRRVLNNMSDLDIEKAFRGIFISCEYKPSKIINRYTSLLNIKKTQWLEHKLIKLMDPKTKADSYRDFIKQIGKYLIIVEKENRSKFESRIKERLTKIRENKELMMEYHDHDIDDLFDARSQCDANNNLDFSNWIKSYFIPEYLKSGDNFIKSRTPSLRKSLTKRNTLRLQMKTSLRNKLDISSVYAENRKSIKKSDSDIEDELQSSNMMNKNPNFTKVGCMKILSKPNNDECFFDPVLTEIFNKIQEK